MCLEALLSRGERHGECTCRALRKESDCDRRHHLAEHAHGIQATYGEEERYDNEELNQIAADNDRGIDTERANDDARLNLCRKLCGKGENSHRQDSDQRANEREEQLLQTMDSLEEHLTVLRLGGKGKSKPRRCRNEHDREDVARDKRSEHIVRHDGEEVIVVGQPLQLARYLRCARADDISGQIRGSEPEEKCQSNRRRTDRRQQRVGDGVGKDAPRVALRPKCSERRDDSKSNRRHGDELEEARKDGCDKAEQVVQCGHVRPAKNAADDECCDPQCELTLLPAELRSRERGLCLLLHLIMRLLLMLICHRKSLHIPRRKKSLIR